MIPPKLMLTIKNKVAVFLLFAAAASFLAGCGPPGPRAFVAGKKLLEQNKYEEAVEKLTTAATLLNTNANAFNYLGVACQHAGRSADAEKAYQHALTLDPDLAEARYNLGCLWLSENKPDQAKSALTAYTLRRASSPDGWLKLGTSQLRCARTAPAYLRSGELASAEHSFNEALRLAPLDAEALTGLGLVRVQRNRPAEAVQCFTRALKEHPDYSPAVLNLAIVEQEHLNDVPLALQKYHEYLALQPNADNANAVKAIVHQLEQDTATPAPRPALSMITPQTNPPSTTQKSTTSEPARNVSSLKPASPTAASAARQSGPAAGTAREPIPSNPDTSAAGTIEVARVPDEPVLKPTQDVSGAAASATPSNAELSAGAHMPSSSANGGFARYAYKSPRKPAAGDRAKAERSFAQGVQAQSAHHLPEAMLAYRRAIQSDPSFFDAWFNLGVAATAAGNLASALTAYEYSLALRPESSDARYNFALVLKQANFPLDAAHELEKLLTSYPNDSRSHLAVGNLYAQQLAQPAKARQHYLKVLETDPSNAQAGAIRYWLTDTSHQ